MTDLPDILKRAPIAMIVLNREDRVVDSNDLARTLGFVAHTMMNDLLIGLEEKFCEAIQHGPPLRSWRVRIDDREKRFQITWQAEGENFFVWFQDISEQVALAEKVRKTKAPSSKQLRQANHQAVTGLGYAELLEVIMDDHDILSGEKLTAVKHYQSEVANTLRAIQRITLNEGKDAAIEPTSIMVAESHAALSELISELLRAEGYRATSFSDAESALKFYALNHHTIQKAVIDETLKSDEEFLTAALKKLAPELEIITLTDNEQIQSPGSVLKPVDFQLLLSAVEGEA